MFNILKVLLESLQQQGRDGSVFALRNLQCKQNKTKQKTSQTDMNQIKI